MCEVTGGGQKVYGVAIEYDDAIDPAHLDPATFAIGVTPVAHGPGMSQELGGNASARGLVPRAVTAIYTNALPALRTDQSGMADAYGITEFAHDPDLSLSIADGDRVFATQKQTLTERCIASIWSLPENQAAHERVVITPR